MLDSRAAHFASWCADGDLTKLLPSLTQGQTLTALGSYLVDLKAGHNLARRADLADKTLANYLQAAAAWLKSHHGLDVAIHGPQGRLHPYLSELLSQRRIWRQARPKKEPIDGDILDALRDMARAQGRSSKEAAVYDWCRLGLFSGSRLAEYGQSTVTKQQPWEPLPNNSDVPHKWRGRPIAFVAEDFTFYDAKFRQCQQCDVVGGAIQPAYVHIRFRYDKSKFNFIFRKFRRISGNHVCPVKASLSILHRAKQLGSHIGVVSPLAYYWHSDERRAKPVTGNDMKSVMQAACRLAHPDASHYLRLHIDNIMSHSLRVTAAVALHNAGVSIDDISFRLRWNSDAVKLYLRDCWRLVGPVTEQAVSGAYLAD